MNNLIVPSNIKDITITITIIIKIMIKIKICLVKFNKFNLIMKKMSKTKKIFKI